MKTIIVVPTIRKEKIKEFLFKWNFPEWLDIIVVEDNPEKSFDVSHPSSTILHYSWKEIDKVFGKDSWIIPRRTDSIRSFGFYMAYKLGADFIITLDDDCYPLDKDFLKRHLAVLDKGLYRWMSTTKDIKPRGIPFKNTGNVPVMVNMGFWRGVSDVDAPTSLVLNVPDLEPNAMLPVPPGFYFPMCGMNLSFKREIVPAMYFLLMGRNYDYDRFGDIWCGLIVKAICDRLGYVITAGMPSVKHERASNVWANLRKEREGLEVNEDLWEYIDEIELDGKTVSQCYNQVAEHFIKKPFKENHYWSKLGEAMKIWLKYIK